MLIVFQTVKQLLFRLFTSICQRRKHITNN